MRVAARRASPADLSALRGQLALQAAHEAASDQEGFHRADEAFHAMLAAIAGQPRFWTVAQQVKTQVDRFRRLTLPVAGRMGSVVAEHAMIVDRLQAHDPDAAAAAMAVHLQTLLGIIETARQAQPGHVLLSGPCRRFGCGRSVSSQFTVPYDGAPIPGHVHCAPSGTCRGNWQV